jgi:aspartate aminotransferase
LLSGKIAAVQSISGTGGCRLGAEFLAKFSNQKTIYVPQPTWGNHLAIFKAAGLTPSYYPYYDNSMNAIDYLQLVSFVRQVDDGSIFLFHACAHNPTGCDLDKDQWNSLSALLKEKKHIVLMDSAYQVRFTARIV